MGLHAGERAIARPIRWFLIGAAATIAMGAASSQEPYTTWRTYGGGGHPRAAGFSTDLPYEEIVEALCAQIEPNG